jgi:hypothetical protein
MMLLYPKTIMFVPVLTLVVSLNGQFGARQIEESRSTAAVRPIVSPNCKVQASGAAFVGSKTAKGGNLKVRSQAGSALLAARGVIRYHFGNKRYDDSVWSFQHLGSAGIRERVLIPEYKEFPNGFGRPEKVEALVLGAAFTDGTNCGEAGERVRSDHDSFLASARKDGEEALAMAAKLSPAEFEAAVRNGLIKDGPYARSTTATSNDIFRKYLLGDGTKLIPGYQQWIKNWIVSFTPAKRALQTRLSPPHGQ